MRLLEGHQRFRVRIFGFCIPHRSKKSHTVGLVVTQAVLGVHDPPEPCLQSVESAQIDDTVGENCAKRFSSDCWQSIMKLPTSMSNWSHLFCKIDSASLIDVMSSCWIMNSPLPSTQHSCGPQGKTMEVPVCTFCMWRP